MLPLCFQWQMRCLRQNRPKKITINWIKNIHKEKWLRLLSLIVYKKSQFDLVEKNINWLVAVNETLEIINPHKQFLKAYSIIYGVDWNAIWLLNWNERLKNNLQTLWWVYFLINLEVFFVCLFFMPSLMGVLFFLFELFLLSFFGPIIHSVFTGSQPMPGTKQKQNTSWSQILNIIISLIERAWSFLDISKSCPG